MKTMDDAVVHWDELMDHMAKACLDEIKAPPPINNYRPMFDRCNKDCDQGVTISCLNCYRD